jgi:phage terminase small subunit
VTEQKLTRKQELFCQYWLEDFNASNAALRAKYSEKTAPYIGAENLKKPKIQKRIAEIQEALRKEAERDPGRMATPTELIEGYTRDIRFDPRLMFDEKGNLKTIPNMPDEIALSLVAFDVDERILLGNDDAQVLQRKFKYKFPDKNRVRDSIARLMGLTSSA